MKSRRETRCGWLVLCAGMVALLGGMVQPAGAQLIAYWHFNDVSNFPTSALVVSQGAGMITLPDWPAEDIVNFSGTTINSVGGAPSGRDLGLEGGTGLVNNGLTMIIAVDTTGLNGIALSFATRRSNTGFNSDQVAYSSDGGMNWTDFGAPYNPATSYGLQAFDFAGVASLNNNPNVQLRITFNGATSGTGNNRFDNLQVVATGALPGACCLPNGACQDVSGATCVTLGGTFEGEGTDCDPNPCFQPTGACCEPMGVCMVRTQLECEGVSGTFRGDGTDCDPNICVGACCDPSGICTLRTPADCAAATGLYQGDGTLCEPNFCVGACCDMAGGTCTIRTELDCEVTNLGIYLGDAVPCEMDSCPPDYDGILINEVRHEQAGSDVDEYFEIINTSGSPKSLNGLTYIVVGDDTDTPNRANSGIIDGVVDLSGFPDLPAGGHFLVADSTLNATLFPGVVPDLVINVPFEGFSDNVTHMLVAGFRGDVGDDIDLNNDCMIDNALWTSVLDRVALTEADNLPGGPPNETECHYGTGDPDIDTFRDGSFSPGHVYRFPDGATGFGAWRVGAFDINFGDDTPGTTNLLATGACCVGAGGCVDDKERLICVQVEGGTWLGRDTDCMTHGAQCQGACCICQNPPTCDAFTCMVTDPVTCAAQAPEGGVYQGALTECPPAPGAVDCAQCLTIADARALSPGTPVRLCDVILSSKTNLINSTSSKSFQIQDATGVDGQSALTVFGTSALIDGQFGSVNEGNQIDIQGTTGEFSGLIQLNSGQEKLLGLSRNDGAAGVPAAVVVTAADFQNESPTAEGFESEIVRLECVVFQQTGTFAAATNYTVSDGTNLVTVRVSTAQQLDIINQPIPQGLVTITGIFSQFDSSSPFDGGYQLQVRTFSDFNTTPSCGPTAACCLAGPSCQVLTENGCNGLGGVWQGLGVPTCDPLPDCPDNLDTRFTEIRIDQDGEDLDEYFELSGTPNAPIGDLTYIVLGDSPDLNSGIIEAVIPLVGNQIPADGYFLAAESTFSLPFTPDFVGNLNFENNDNVTHMLVKGFTGALIDDLDTNDDGVLDTEPWAMLLDKLAIIRQHNPPTTTEWHYGPPLIGPVAGTSPGHVALCPSAPPEWRIEAFDVDSGDDTPGEPNPAICGCAGCLGDMDTNGFLNALDVQGFADTLVGMTANGCADINLDASIDLDDLLPFVDRILAAPPCGLDRAFGTRIVTWNLLAYNGAAPSDRKDAYKRIMNHLNADVVVVQEVENITGAQDFLDTVLNATNGPGGYSMADFTNGPDSDNALYYRDDKIIYMTGDHTTLATTPRITDRWKLDHVDAVADEGILYVYGTHLKADSGNPPQDQADRQAAAAIIRADANALPAGTQIVVAGDMNLNSSSEGAWTEFTDTQVDDDGRTFDPISAPGNWSANCTFAGIHTQSPHQDNTGSPPGGANGGLDDRFDFMLISDALRDGIGLSYIGNSYRAFGNDGNHCNADINDPPTIPEGQYIADALHTASDHLPVHLELGLFVAP